jgi:hypothetical protein
VWETVRGRNSSSLGTPLDASTNTALRKLRRLLGVLMLFILGFSLMSRGVVFLSKEVSRFAAARCVCGA